MNGVVLRIPELARQPDVGALHPARSNASCDFLLILVHERAVDVPVVALQRSFHCLVHLSLRADGIAKCRIRGSHTGGDRQVPRPRAGIDSLLYSRFTRREDASWVLELTDRIRQRVAGRNRARDSILKT